MNDSDLMSSVQICVGKRHNTLRWQVTCVDDVVSVVNMCGSTRLDSYILTSDEDDDHI